MFRYLFLIASLLVLASCTFDLKLIKGASDESSIVAPDMIDAGFVNQTLPAALNKTAAHFGTISPQKYYFIQPGDSSKVVRKFVKISGGVKTELDLPDNVISHRYAFSTDTQIFYFANVRTGTNSSRSYLKAIDKAGFTLVDWQCNTGDIDFDVDDFEVYREGAEGFYFRVNSANPLIVPHNGRIYYADGAFCTDTGVVAKKMWQASNRWFVVDQAGSLREMIGGTPQTPIVDGATNPVVSGMVIYNGDLYFRRQTAAGPTYGISRAQTSNMDAVSNLGFDSANWVGLESTAESINGTQFVWCITGKCVGSTNVYYVLMSAPAAPISLHFSAAFGPARVLPMTATIQTARGVSGRYLHSANSGTPNLDTGMDSQYLGTLATEKVPENFPQQVYFNSQYYSEYFDSSIGESLIIARDPTSLANTTAFPALKNTHSIRLRDGEMFFLGHVNEKIQLYRSDGTVGGTSIVSQITSDDYRLGSDFQTNSRLVRRSFDIAKDGTDLYVFTASQESVYLAELDNGTMKYVKIPGAAYHYGASRILQVTSGAIYFANPAHYHLGHDNLGTAQPRHQAPGVQILSYDGAGFTYWLRSNYALPAYTSYAFSASGQGWLGIGNSRIITLLVSSISSGGLYLRKTYALTSTTQTEVVSSDTPHSKVSANGDRFIYYAMASAPADAGLWLERSGVQLKLTTDAENARSFRWNGNTVYFVAEDSTDGLIYIWQVDTTQTTPVPTKVSAAVVIGSAKEEALTKRVLTVGSDVYLLFPSSTSDDTDTMTTAFNLWKVSSGTATLDSTTEVEEVLPVSTGFYYIGKPTAGPDLGKRCVFKNTSEGTGQTVCEKFMASLKPSPLGVSVAVNSKLFQVKADLTLVEIASLIGGTATETDFDTTMDTYLGFESYNNMSSIMRFSSAGGKVFNLGLDSNGLTWSAITRNTDGTSPTETTFTGNDAQADYTTGLVVQQTERATYYSFQQGYTPQANSILFSTRNDDNTEHFRVIGASGILNANIP